MSMATLCMEACFFAINLLVLVSCDFIFHHFGDPQIGFGTDGWENDVARFSQAASLAVGDNSSQVCIAGDLVNTWNNQTELDGFDSVWPDDFERVPVGLVPGNHDVNSEGSGADEMLTQLSTYRTRYGADYHSVFLSYGSIEVVLIGIDSEIFISNYTELDDERTTQWNWLEATLQNTTTKSAVFIFMHHPPFITTEDEVDSYWNWPSDVRAQFLSLIRSFNVQHLLCGHTHTTTLVTSADKAFTIYTVGGTARVFDDNGFGVRVFDVQDNGGGIWSVSSKYQQLPSIYQSNEPCVDVPIGPTHSHPYFCVYE